MSHTYTCLVFNPCPPLPPLSYQPWCQPLPGISRGSCIPVTRLPDYSHSKDQKETSTNGSYQVCLHEFIHHLSFTDLPASSSPVLCDDRHLGCRRHLEWCGLLIRGNLYFHKKPSISSSMWHFPGRLNTASFTEA